VVDADDRSTGSRLDNVHVGIPFATPEDQKPRAKTFPQHTTRLTIGMRFLPGEPIHMQIQIQIRTSI